MGRELYIWPLRSVHRGGAQSPDRRPQSRRRPATTAQAARGRPVGGGCAGLVEYPAVHPTEPESRAWQRSRADVKITPGKLAGMKAVSTGTGTIAAAAMDQRGSLKKALGKARGADALTRCWRSSSPSSPRRSPRTPPPSCSIRNGDRGRRSSGAPTRDFSSPTRERLRQHAPGPPADLLPDWSVRRLKEAGADCVKVLIYYTPATPRRSTREARVHRAHRRRVPHERHPILPGVSAYDHEGGDEKGPTFARTKPDVVARSMEEFSRDRYGVDVMKVEIPVNMKFVEGTRSFQGTAVYTKDAAWSRSARRPPWRASRSSTCPRA